MEAVKRRLILEDGSIFDGFGFGAGVDKVCTLAFNTAMIGYHEVVSDPAYTDLGVVMTYPIIGSYGVTDEDFETRFPTAAALIVGEYNDQPSNFRFTKTLSEIMEDYEIPGIEGIDTRRLTRIIRDKGAMRALICSGDTEVSEALEVIKSTPVPTEAVKRVSCRKKWYSRTPNHKFDVTLIDCGVKLSVIRALKAVGCNVTVVPYNTAAEEILAAKPQGVVVSGGPGAPEELACVCETINQLRGNVPVFAYGLGFQLACLVYGAESYKLPFAQCGANHAVRNTVTGKLDTVSLVQTHAICEKSLAATELAVTHIDLLNGCVQGVSCEKDKLFAVQHNPDLRIFGSGSGKLFDKFIQAMAEVK